MNISQVKKYIKDSVRMYLKKNEFEEYKIPVVRQRPVFLLGAPGIGKTAVMEQVAQELGIALVSYSMTHHTRQSALGLPFIKTKEYGGESYDISEYTMSEIIASIYETMEISGIREGILFLDEINCVSETLAPSMLQFLQYKVFGRHKVPEGWVIVTAGNPPEYNRSVREFDIVTMDRLKVLEVEADFEDWKIYALGKGIHNAIINYLDINKDDFYRMETTTKGRSYVTARGWEDLSEIISLYEEDGLKVDETLVGQYIRSDKIVKEFTAYYDLYNKYKKDYHVEDIFSGSVRDEVKNRVGRAAFDERLSLLGMLIDKAISEIKDNIMKMDYLSSLMPYLKAVRAKAEGAPLQTVTDLIAKQGEAVTRLLESKQKANTLSGEERKKYKRMESFFLKAEKAVNASDAGTGEEAFTVLKKEFDSKVAEVKEVTGRIQERLHHLFMFVEEAFRDGNEMLLLVTELTVNTYGAKFIATFGCEDYRRHSEELMLTERQGEIQKAIEELEI